MESGSPVLTVPLSFFPERNEVLLLFRPDTVGEKISKLPKRNETGLKRIYHKEEKKTNKETSGGEFLVGAPTYP